MSAAFLHYAQRTSVRCLLIIAIGVGVHFPALHGDLIWDDIQLVSNNP